jgi:hypothetical protein
MTDLFGVVRLAERLDVDLEAAERLAAMVTDEDMEDVE